METFYRYKHPGSCISHDMTLFFDLKLRDSILTRIQGRISDDLHYKLNNACLVIFTAVLNLRNSLSYLYYKNKTNNFES